MLSTVKDISIVVAGLVAFITFATGVVQYVRQTRIQRIQNFVEMRRRFLEDTTFRNLLNLLATDDPALAGAQVQDRRNLVGFFEEIALMVNSGALSIQVAHYMFGYYVALVDRSENFWVNLDKPGVYWTVFRRFSARLAEREKEAGRDAPLRF
ncbi:MAG: hypothetical protein KF812_03010 [Fimbriimonadaceae bacterium]|nr:hypothetical protein [Fimbriimonadaceae bacterium]